MQALSLQAQVWSRRIDFSTWSIRLCASFRRQNDPAPYYYCPTALSLPHRPITALPTPTALPPYRPALTTTPLLLCCRCPLARGPGISNNVSTSTPHDLLVTRVVSPPARKRQNTKPSEDCWSIFVNCRPFSSTRQQTPDTPDTTPPAPLPRSNVLSATTC